MLAAQSAGDVAAWDALVLSPVGALPPLARTAATGDSTRTELTFRYGRWRFDVDDAIHNNMAITLSRNLGFANTELALTGAYLSQSCSLCSSWASAGIDLQSTLWHHSFPGDSLVRTETGILGVRAAFGGARYLGDGHAMAMSMAGAVAVGIDLAFARNSHFSVTVMPGFGVGRIVSVDETAYGTRPMFGAAAAWKFRSWPALNFGMEKVFLTDGPIQIGTGLSWRIR
jgi:hypothetical protein